MKTKLNKWYDDANGVYTRDTWEISELGTFIRCTGWRSEKTIKPWGDGCHVNVNGECLHCDQLMGYLIRWEEEGYTWSIDGVEMTREQYIDGRWKGVEV